MQSNRIFNVITSFFSHFHSSCFVLYLIPIRFLFDYILYHSLLLFSALLFSFPTQMLRTFSYFAPMHVEWMVSERSFNVHKIPTKKEKQKERRKKK